MDTSIKRPILRAAVTLQLCRVHKVFYIDKPDFLIFFDSIPSVFLKNEYTLAI